MKNTIILIVLLTTLFSCVNKSKTESIPKGSPPMGWNSFDSYCIYINEKQVAENIDAFAEKLKPAGYEYFVIDAGWYAEYELREGTMLSKEFHATKFSLNEYGLLQPSKTYFPNGLKPLIKHCHELGIKFGLHLMRGIPREVVRKNLPIKGTNFRASDIADKVNICDWNPDNYGVDMNKPGAQEFYNSLINQLAEWGVDFIKYDDIVTHPKEIEAVTKAIKQCGRPILLSLSPGDIVNPDAIDTYTKANMLRVTMDIWDTQESIDVSFAAMRKWQGNNYDNFWIDLDMIPFGQLQITVPKPNGFDCETMNKYEIIKEQKKGKYKDMILLGGKGFHRWCQLSKDQMYTFITQRAISAAPLMVGGDLISIDSFSLNLLTNSDMIECNQNGIRSKLIYNADSIEIWKAVQNNSHNKWLAIFNRNKKDFTIKLSNELLQIENEKSIFDIWNKKNINLNSNQTINANGVLFLKQQ